jgi:hypothetical protein
MKVLCVALALALVLAFAPPGAPPAAACVCASWFLQDDEQIQEFIDRAEVVIVGRAENVRVDSGGYKVATITVERIYAGNPPSALVVRGSNLSWGTSCDYTIAETGERHFLSLRSIDGGQYETDDCSAFPMAWVERQEPIQPHRDFLAAFERAAPPREPPAPPTAGDGNARWVALAAAAGALALLTAVSAALAAAERRRT